MKFIAFGDSFVKMFLHCQPEVKHWKFKGKSIRGLIKEGDTERARIEREISKAPFGTKIILFFGQVDFNYVRYYKVIKGEAPIGEETFKKYIEWVSSLNRNVNISIVSIFPSPVKKEYIIASLISKGSYTVESQDGTIDKKILEEFDKSEETWNQWNSWIENYCQINKVKNIKLFTSHSLDPKFLDISNLTIHLRYVPVLEEVKKHFDIKFDARKAEEIEKQYEQDKTERIESAIIRANSTVETGKEEQVIKEIENSEKPKRFEAASVEKENDELETNVIEQLPEVEPVLESVEVSEEPQKKKKKKNKNKVKKYVAPKTLKNIKTKLESSEDEQEKEREFDPDSDSQDEEGDMFLKMAKNRSKK